MTAADVILVGCTKQKRDERSTAADLYDPSDLFRRRRAYAESTGLPWGILSARYGTLEPWQMVDPYDLTIAQRRTAEWGPFRLWGIQAIQGAFRLAGRHAEYVDGEQFRRFVEPLTIEVHAGIDYVRGLELALCAYATEITITHPVRGLQIGEQKQHYARTLAEVVEVVEPEQMAFAL